MKKSLIIIGIVLIVCLFLAGCTQNNPAETNTNIENNQPLTETQGNNQHIQNPDKVEPKPEESKITSIDDLLSKLENHFELGEKEETYYQMIGAYDGTKINVDDTKVEIYQYKDSQKEAMTSAQDTGDTADNQIFIVEDNFLILVHSKDQEFSNKIKEAVN